MINENRDAAGCVCVCVRVRTCACVCVCGGRVLGQALCFSMLPVLELGDPLLAGEEYIYHSTTWGPLLITFDHGVTDVVPFKRPRACLQAIITCSRGGLCIPDFH